MGKNDLLMTGLVAGALTGYLSDRRRGAERDLEQRIRSVVGHYVSNPRAIDVQVDDGRVVLSGAVLTREANDLLAAVYRVAEGRSVFNRLNYQDTAVEVPAPHASARTSSATRLVASSAGGLLVGWGLWRRDGLGLLLGTSGLALIACALVPRARRARRAPLGFHERMMIRASLQDF
jgi:hypothetical protein